MPTPPIGRVASAARVLTPEEVEQLAAIALALPDGWVCAVEPPAGQLAILPRGEVRQHVRCFVADKSSRRITRIGWRPAL